MKRIAETIIDSDNNEKCIKKNTKTHESIYM